MATTIVNPAPSTNSSGSNIAGLLFGAIILIVFVALFFVYALPFLRSLSGIGSGGVQVNVPKNINVNVQQTK
jgi:hypothetical protein